MKKLLFSFVFIFTFFCSYSKNTDVVDDVNKCIDMYNTEINKINILLNDFNLWVTTTKDTKEQRIADGKRKTATISKQLTNSIQAVQKMPTIDGDNSFRDTSVYIFTTLREINEGSDMLVVINYDDSKSVDDLKAFYMAFNKMSKLSDHCLSIIPKKITEMCKKYDIPQSNEKEDPKIEQQLAVIDYINSFAAPTAIITKYYNQALTQINTGKNEEARKTVVEMRKYCLKAIPRLEKIKGFKGNENYIKSQRKKANYLANEGYNLLKQVISSGMTYNKYKDKEDLTKEEHKTYSDAIDKYNNGNNQLNAEFQPIVNKCNQELANLMNKYYR